MELGITTGGGNGTIIREYTAGNNIDAGVFCDINSDGKIYEIIDEIVYNHTNETLDDYYKYYNKTAILSENLGVVVNTRYQHGKITAFRFNTHAGGSMTFGTSQTLSSNYNFQPIRYNNNSFVMIANDSTNTNGKIIYGVVNNDLSITISDISATDIATSSSYNTKILVLDDGYIVVFGRDNENGYLSKWLYRINNGAIEQVGVKEVMISFTTSQSFELRSYINQNDEVYVYMGGKGMVKAQQYSGNGTFGATNTYAYLNTTNDYGCSGIVINKERDHATIYVGANEGGYTRHYRVIGAFTDTTGAMSSFSDVLNPPDYNIYENNHYIYIDNYKTYIDASGNIYEVSSDASGVLSNTLLLSQYTADGDYTSGEGASILYVHEALYITIGATYTHSGLIYTAVRLSAKNNYEHPFGFAMQDIPQGSKGKICLSGLCTTQDDLGLEIGKSYDKEFIETTTADNKRITKIDTKAYIITPCWVLDDNN